MTDQATNPSSVDTERLVAEYREMIVKLEAHGGLADGGSALWDVLGDILADIKRHQAQIHPDDGTRI